MLPAAMLFTSVVYVNTKQAEALKPNLSVGGKPSSTLFHGTSGGLVVLCGRHFW